MVEMKSPRIRYLSNSILIFSAAIALILTLYTSRKSVKLHEENTKLKSKVLTLSGTLVGPASAQVGDIVPPFQSLNPEGQKGSVIYDGSTKYLLYIFSPLA